MGTNSIFMHSMSSKDANQNLMTKRAQKQPRCITKLFLDVLSECFPT